MQERKPADPLRLKLEQPFDRQESFKNTFRIIQPLDAHSQSMPMRDLIHRADVRAARLHGRAWDSTRLGHSMEIG